MIRDTCCCGAQFESSDQFAPYNTNRHVTWLAAHEVCRYKDVVTATETTDAYEVRVTESTEPVRTIRKVVCHCGNPGWGDNGCCGVSGCNNVPA